MITVQNMCARKRVLSQQWEGHTLVQVKGPRISLLCKVHVLKPSLQYLKHTYEYKETDRNRQKQTVHVQDLTVLSIYQKAVAFDHNLNHYT